MKPVTNVITGGLASLATRVLPERTKRLMFLASLSAHLKETNQMSTESLRKINELFSLSADDNALKFPVHLSHAIWRNRPLEPGVRQSLTSEDKLPKAGPAIAAIARKVIDAMPACLRYDEPKMESDVVDLLRNLQQVGA
jgi:hypothetical protein